MSRIPAHTMSGVLPPYSGADPTRRAAMAPYRATLAEVIGRFGTTAPRMAILQGLLKYRAALRSAGFNSGFQWLAGSFVEEVERHQNRAPRDVDVVTFVTRPEGYTASDWGNFVTSRSNLLDPNECKRVYSCDAYLVDMTVPPEYLVNQTKYWFGLFSHQRTTLLWKGTIQVDLMDDAEDGAAILADGGNHAP